MVESTILRSHGLTGSGADDAFVELCWSKFLGSGDFSFDVKRRKRKRMEANPLAQGSLVLHWMIKHRTALRWSRRDIRKTAEGHSRDGPKRMTQWRHALRRRRAD